MGINQKRLITDLKNLISIPSYENEKGVADYIIQELRKEGLKSIKDKYGNVILTIGKGDGFLLNSHMDTVGIDGWEDSALVPKVKSDRIIGRGSSDTKSGIATMIEIARLVKDFKLKRKIIFIFSINEENSRLDENGAYLSSKSIKAKEGIILEPVFKGKKLNIGVGCKGAYRFNITIHGRSCHSSKPELGINALYLANDFINEFRKIKIKYKKYKILNKVVNLTSVATVTQIKAEEGTNVIPSRCNLCIDYRSLPDEKSKHVINQILKLCKKHFKYGFDFDEYCIDGYFDYDAKMVKLMDSIANKFGYKPDFKIREGRNDSCIFSNYAKIKSVCFGSGESQQGHTVGEYVSIKGFLDCSEMLFKAVKEICS